MPPEGTTFLDRFDPACYYLFGADELNEALAEWDILEEVFHDFEAPQSTLSSASQQSSLVAKSSFLISR